MNNVVNKSRDYIRQMNLVDLGLIKLCLLSLGILLGLSVPGRHKKKAAAGASTLFAATYAPIMAKYLVAMLGENAKPKAFRKQAEK